MRGILRAVYDRPESLLLSLQADLQSVGNALFGIQRPRLRRSPGPSPRWCWPLVCLGCLAILRSPRARGGDRAVTATIEYVRASRWYGPVIALNDVTTTVGAGRHRPARPQRRGQVHVPEAGRGPARAQPGRGARCSAGPPGARRSSSTTWACARRRTPSGKALTGLQFVTALLRLTGFDEAECRAARGGARWTQVALLEAKDRKIGGYSKGMRQRVKLAQALAHDPQVLLLDEPVSGMDPVNRRRVVDLVKRLGREGRTVLVSSHILHEVEAMTRRVLLIHNGRILAEGDVREIRDLMDEHPHTVALRARDPRALARAVVGSPHVLSLTFGAEGEWVTVQTARPDEFYGVAARGGAGGGRLRDVLAGREPGVGLQVPGGAMRDTTQPLPFLRRRARRLRPLPGGMVWSRRSLMMAVLLGLPIVFALVYRVVLAAKLPAAPERLRPLRRRDRLLLRAQRAAPGRALLRDRAHRGRGGGQDAHLPAHAAHPRAARSWPASSRPTW